MRKLRTMAAAALIGLAMGGGPVADGGPGAPVGGFKSQTCMAAVYEALGIWAFRPYAVAVVWGMTCAWMG